jgi:hypothetical protein
MFTTYMSHWHQTQSKESCPPAWCDRSFIWERSALPWTRMDHGRHNTHLQHTHAASPRSLDAVRRSSASAIALISKMSSWPPGFGEDVALSPSRFAAWGMSSLVVIPRSGVMTCDADHMEFCYRPQVCFIHPCVNVCRRARTQRPFVKSDLFALHGRVRAWFCDDMSMILRHVTRLA